ncbi:M6dom_TIGR03296, M6 family metalloprotease domain [actinobacterium SCGC AAA044-D11]
MRIKVLVAKSLLVALPLTLISQVASSAPKITPGASCKVNKQSVTFLTKTYTCIKKGKKLIWSKGSAVPVKTPEVPAKTPEVPAKTPEVPAKTPEVATMTYAPPTQLSSEIETCKLKEDNNNRRGMQSVLASGFPTITNLAVKTGTVKWALIPIDFPDLPGESNFRIRVDSQMRLLSDWYETVSEGKFKIEWVVQDKWVTLPGITSDYVIPLSVNLNNAANGPKIFKDAMTAADPVFDFTSIQTVNFILPSGQTFIGEGSQGFPWDQAVKETSTKEGSISSYSIPGKFFDQPGRLYWSYWAHEFGHAMALPHIGSSREPNAYMGLDLMSNQDGESRELSGWLRFVAGWLPDEKVYCKELTKLESTDITLVPLNERDTGIKMVVVPISQSKAIIIESRREGKFTCSMPSKRSGVLAYLYDAKLSHGENFLQPITPDGRAPEVGSNCQVQPYPNPILYKGQKIFVEGLSIEIIDSRNFDKIRISKAS